MTLMHFIAILSKWKICYIFENKNSGTDENVCLEVLLSDKNWNIKMNFKFYILM